MTAIRKRSPNLAMFKGRVMRPKKQQERQQEGTEEEEDEEVTDDETVEPSYVNADWDTVSIASMAPSDQYDRIKRLLRVSETDVYFHSRSPQQSSDIVSVAESEGEQLTRERAEAHARRQLLDLVDGASDDETDDDLF